jgi:hypothetical protein
MTLRSCPHEAEIRQLLELGHWPQSCPPELRAHVDNCRACGDLVLVTEAFGGARVVSMNAAELPPPGVLWWRAQLRRRNTAVAQINKPILGAQIFAFVITLLVAIGFLVSQAGHSLHWLSSLGNGMGDWLASLSQSQAFHLEVLWPFASARFDAALLTLVPGVAILVLLSGVVLYLTSEKH